ncbi:hypothetical protein ACQUQU_06890 [Thalassolituus sp. LLYu03]|uniref:hypothetical protein n=1 Tax=Thalassolituus sp. LLYu03 TaxID=3421656 RepID=UPI003D26739D
MDKPHSLPSVRSAVGAASPASGDALALGWLLRQSAADRWRMEHNELALLLGLTDDAFAKALQALDRGQPQALPADVSERIGCLFRLDCILSIVMSAEQRYEAFGLPTSGTSFFAGLSVRDFLLAKPETRRFYEVCNYLQGHVVLGRPLDLNRLR